MSNNQTKKASDKAGRNKKYAENYFRNNVAKRNKLRRMLKHIRQGRHADDLATAAALTVMGVHKDKVADLRTQASASTERNRKDKAAQQRRAARTAYGILKRASRKLLPAITPDTQRNQSA